MRASERAKRFRERDKTEPDLPWAIRMELADQGVWMAVGAVVAGGLALTTSPHLWWVAGALALASLLWGLSVKSR